MRNILHSLAQIDVSPLPNSDKSNTDYAQGFVGTILPIVFGTIGVVCVLIIVIAGLRYIFANGDAASMAKAKSAIMYALIGLAISLAAFSIVTFVVRGVS